MNPFDIRALIHEKTETHRELRRPLGWDGFQRICKREQIRVIRMSLPRPAQLVPYRGRWAIFLNRDLHPRRFTAYGAHELGHLWMHHDTGCDRWERCFNLDIDWADDPREEEAENFATMVMQGPRFTAGLYLEPEPKPVERVWHPPAPSIFIPPPDEVPW